jgi:hypothetical protein
MVTVQFQAKVKDGAIQIPRKYQGRFSEHVRVILKAEVKKGSAHNYLDSLMANPVKAKNFKILTRDQIYAR